MSFKKGDKVWVNVRMVGITGDARTEWRKGRVLAVGDSGLEFLVKIRGIGVRGRAHNQMVSR